MQYTAIAVYFQISASLSLWGTEKLSSHFSHWWPELATTKHSSAGPAASLVVEITLPLKMENSSIFCGCEVLN